MTASRRWRLDLAYDGTAYSGWADQPHRRTVQGELERWIPQVLRLSQPVSLVVAGRTDAGVHARGQVAHVDLPEAATDEVARLRSRLARVLPADVVVRDVTVAPAGFDARFSALWRRYVYRLSDGEVPPDPLLRSQITHVRSRLDLEAVNAAGASLLGLRDFGAFCRRREGATTIRTLLELTGRRVEDGPLAGVVELTVRADAFCHSMVRSLVGALTAVGSGRRDLEWLRSTAAAGVRAPGVDVLPARGLTLEEVRYPADSELAGRAQEARSTRRTDA